MEFFSITYTFPYIYGSGRFDRMIVAEQLGETEYEFGAIDSALRMTVFSLLD